MKKLLKKLYWMIEDWKNWHVKMNVPIDIEIID